MMVDEEGGQYFAADSLFAVKIVQLAIRSVARASTCYSVGCRDHNQLHPDIYVTTALGNLLLILF
jgi:hypothetical protein